MLRESASARNVVFAQVGTFEKKARRVFSLGGLGWQLNSECGGLPDLQTAPSYLIG